jgi:uncharacterized protein YegL
MILVDTSGSMEDNSKLESVKKSLRFMLSLLSPEDRLSLITFDNDATLILNKVVPDAANLDATLYKIDMLRVNGSTNMSAGLLEARSIIEPATTGRKQGIVLLTDGHANVGSATPDAIVNIIRRILYENSGVSLSTTGYGSDHNADLLMQIAQEGGGAYNVVSNLEDVASTFGDILGGLVSVSAQRVQVKFPAAYTVKTSYPTQVTDGGVTVVTVGDVYAETEVAILFEATGSPDVVYVVGTNMMTLNPIDVALVPLAVSSDVYPVAFTVGELKVEVSNMLKAIRSSRIVTVAEIDALRDKLLNVVHPIIQFLLADLDQAKAIVRSGHMTQEDAVDLTQHSAYIGMSRGIRSITSPQRQARFSQHDHYHDNDHDQENDPVAPRAPPPMLSPTANAVQRSMTGAMRSMTGGGSN